MSQKPAVLITEEVIGILQTNAVQLATFNQLTGADHAWEVDDQAFKTMIAKLATLESGIRSKQPDQNITCFLTDKGAYWLPQAGIDLVSQALEGVQKDIKEDGPMPVWNCTSAELLTNHLANMRRLLLAAGHDLVLINNLKDNLGSNHSFMHREFDLCTNGIRKMREAIQSQAPIFSCVTTKDIVLFERCRITFDLLEKGEKTETELGYDTGQLKKAQEILDKRCLQAIPNFQNQIREIAGDLQESLRLGESAQLTRATKWELAFGLLDAIPSCYQGQAQMATLERKGLSSLVSSRETELGQSEAGQETLAETTKVVEAIKNGTVADLAEPPLGTALTDEEIQALLTPKEDTTKDAAAAGQGASSSKKSKSSTKQRMAFQKRRR